MKKIESQTEFLDTLIQNCNLCELTKFETNVKFGKMTGFGTGKKYFMIGQNPSNRRNNSFGGHGILPDFTFSNTPEGQIARCFKEVDLSWDDFYVTNLVKCSTPENEKPNEDTLNKCTSTYLAQEYFAVGCPDRVICLGEYVHEFIKQNSVVPKYSKIYRMFHPSYVNRTPEVFDEWVEQFKRMKEEK
jgi:uracil-DNA glycosylase family 4